MEGGEEMNVELEEVTNGEWLWYDTVEEDHAVGVWSKVPVKISLINGEMNIRPIDTN